MILNINIANIIFLLSILPVALLARGIKRKIVARMQNRMGPPIWQSFFDIAKLWRKGGSDSLAKKNVFFSNTPAIYFLTTLIPFLFIPFSLISFEYDFILLVYLLVLNSALYVIIGLASNNPFSIISSMRDLSLMVCYEMIIVISVATIFAFEGATSIASLEAPFLFWRLPLAAVCFFCVVLIEARVTPYDTIEASTEVLEGAKSEYSGKGLAFLDLSEDLKMIFFSMLFVFLFVGVNNLWLFFALSILMIPILAFTQATTGRYRMDQTLRLFVIFLIIAMIEFVRIKFIRW